MNKYLLVFLFLVFIMINETLPFLYNESYTIRDIKWGWVIGFPLLLYIAKSFKKDEPKKED